MPPRLVDAPTCLRFQQCFHRRASPFSTTTSTKAQIPPESPKYIDIPQSVQPQQLYRPFMKGVLPVPRPLFPRKPKPGKPDKASPEYLAGVTMEPISDKRDPSKLIDPRTAEYVSWRARQAESRRRNLRESLVALSERKQRTDKYLSERSYRRQTERNSLLYAPEREDERLTNPSVLASEKPTKRHFLPDPNREVRLARKRENVAKMNALREENRRNALHTLYVNAGDFITTEAQLDAVIDQTFDDRWQFVNDSTAGLNIWHLGFPETVQELLGKANRASKGQKAMESAEGDAGLTRERMRRISEELTGGKMMENGR